MFFFCNGPMISRLNDALRDSSNRGIQSADEWIKAIFNKKKFKFRDSSNLQKKQFQLNDS